MKKQTIGQWLLATALVSAVGLALTWWGTPAEAAERTPAPAETESPLATELPGVWIAVGTPGAVGKPPDAGGRYKFIGGGQWAITQAHPQTGHVIYHHGGTYTLDADKYIEVVKYATDNTTNLIGVTNTFQIKTEGDTYTQIGIGNPYSEVLKRLTPAAACARPGDALLGTWRLLSAKYGGQETDVAALGTTLKHVGPTQVVWMSYQNDTKVYRSAGGPYRVTADAYEEMPEYGVGQAFETVKGQRHKFNWKVEGNKWFHTGQLANGLTIEEVWERVVAE